MMQLVACGLTVLLSVASVGHAKPSVELTPLSFETGLKAAQPSVAVDPDEGFVVTWQERDAEGSALRFAVVDRNGRELRRGTVSSGPNRFVNNADFPNLAVLDNGDWVTFWLQKTASGTYAYEVRTTRSRDRGRTWDPAVIVHRDATPTEHGFVSMVPAGRDRVRLIWLDGRRMAATADAHGEGGDEHMTLRSAVLGRDGAPKDEQELDALTCACCQTDMARDGNLVVAAYRDRTSEELRDIDIVSFRGDTWSKPHRLHADNWTMPACPVNGPAIAARNDQWFAVWPTMAEGEMDIRARIGRAGRFEAPMVVIASGAAELGRVDVAPAGDDRWLVSRVVTRTTAPALLLTLVDSRGKTVSETEVANPVGGYPRVASQGDDGLMAYTVPKGRGETTVGLTKIRFSEPPR